MATDIGTIRGTIRLEDKFTFQLKKATTQLEVAGKKMQAVGQRMSTVGSQLTRSITLPIVALGALTIKAASDFESSFAGVRKTVDATEEEFADLAQGMRDLSKEIPVNVNELNRLGEAAGQLGIETENILSFTETMAALGVTTNISAEEASTSLARLINITGLAQDEVERLGSTIVALGNNFATTEAEIVEFATRIAGAGTIAGLAEAEILAIGAAMTSVGVKAEAGGTSVQKVLLEMIQAVAQGGEKLDVFAETAGQSASEFARAFRDDAAVAFTDFVEGLGTQGDRAFVTLEKLNLQDQRLIRSFLSLAGAGDLLRRSLDEGNRAFSENTALAIEAAQRYETFRSQLTLTWNRIKDVAITLGLSLLPVLRDGLDVLTPWIERLASLTEWFSKLPKPVRLTALAVGALLAVVGPLVFVLGNLTIVAGFASTAIATLGSTSLASSIGVKSLALWAGRLAIPLTAIAVLFAAIDQQGQRVAKRVAELSAELASGAVTAEQLREKMERLVAVPVRQRVGAATEEIMAIRQALEDLAKPVAETTDGVDKAAAAFQALTDGLGGEGGFGPVLSETADEARKLSKELTAQLKVLELEKSAMATSGAAAVMLRTEIGLLAVAERLAVDVTSVHVQGLLEQVTALAAFEQATIDAEKAATRKTRVLGLLAKMQTILTKALKERDDAQRDLFDTTVDSLAQAARVLNDQRLLAAAWDDGAEAVDRLNNPIRVLARQLEQVLGAGNPVVVLLQNMADESDELAASIKEAENAASSATAGFREMSQGFANAITQMILGADSFGDALRAMLEGQLRRSVTAFAQTFVESFEKSREAGVNTIQSIVDAWEEAKDQLVGVANAIAAGFAAASGETADLLVGLATVGANLAAQNYAGAAIAGIGVLTGLFKKFRKSVDEVANSLTRMGLKISEELTARIRELVKIIGNADAAIRAFLADIIEESGISDENQLRKFAAQAGILFSDLQAGLISGRAAAIGFANAMDLILDAFEDVGGTALELRIILDGYLTMLELVESGQIDAADATEALNQTFAAFVDAARSLGATGVIAIMDLVDAAREAGVEFEALGLVIKDVLDEALGILEERGAFLIQQSGDLVQAIEDLFAAGGVGARDLQFAADSIFAAFVAMQEAGLSLFQIAARLADVLELIRERGEQLGANLPEAFGRLGEILDILSGPKITRFLAQLEAITNATQALGNMGLLTADQFDLFGDRARRAFNQLVAGGLSQQEALAAIAPQLQLLADLQQQYGFEIDKNTQRLIDQAREQGLIQDKQLSVNDILIRGFDSILAGLNALIVAMGGVPVAFADWTLAGEEFADDIQEIEEGLEDDLSSPIGGIGREFDDMWKRVVDSAQISANKTIEVWEDAVRRIMAAFQTAAASNPLSNNVLQFPSGPAGGSIAQFSHGSGGLRDFGIGTPAILNGREEILTERQGSGVASMVAGVLAGSGKGDGKLDMLIRSIDDLSRNIFREQVDVEIERRDEGIKSRA